MNIKKIPRFSIYYTFSLSFIFKEISSTLSLYHLRYHITLPVPGHSSQTPGHLPSRSPLVDHRLRPLISNTNSRSTPPLNHCHWSLASFISTKTISSVSHLSHPPTSTPTACPCVTGAQHPLTLESSLVPLTRGTLSPQPYASHLSLWHHNQAGKKQTLTRHLENREKITGRMQRPDWGCVEQQGAIHQPDTLSWGNSEAHNWSVCEQRLGKVKHRLGNAWKCLCVSDTALSLQFTRDNSSRRQSFGQHRSWRSFLQVCFTVKAMLHFSLVFFLCVWNTSQTTVF